MENKQIETFRRTIRRIGAESQNQLKQGEACCGVSLAQCHALMELGQTGPLSIKQLSRLLRLDKSTLSRTVESLVRSGKAERTTRLEDRRFAVVKLTQDGQAHFERINHACNRLYRQVLRHIPKDKQAQVIEGLTLFADAVEAAHADLKEMETPACGTSPSDSEEKGRT